MQVVDFIMENRTNMANIAMAIDFAKDFEYMAFHRMGIFMVVYTDKKKIWSSQSWLAMTHISIFWPWIVAAMQYNFFINMKVCTNSQQQRLQTGNYLAVEN